MHCNFPLPCHPTDMTHIPLCPPPVPVSSTKNPFCGCPKDIENCWDCRPPGILETRILRPPQVCLKPPCNYVIPAMSCRIPCKPLPEPECNPLCFDWTVDEPGPNDSYGLHGLNWHDWKMEDITKSSFRPLMKGYIPAHPGFTEAPAPSDTPSYIANQPLECYGAQPPCKREPFALDVNCLRDWRCPDYRPPHAWEPQNVVGATKWNL